MADIRKAPEFNDKSYNQTLWVGSRSKKDNCKFPMAGEVEEEYQSRDCMNAV